MISNAIRVEVETVAGTVARRTDRRPYQVSELERAEPALEVAGNERGQEDEDEDAARDRRGDDREARRVGACEDTGAEQDPAEDQREQVDGVHDDQEGDHPRRGLLTRHAGLAKRPVGEDDAAGAPGREQAGRREARHVDLVALGPGQRAGRRRRRPP